MKYINLILFIIAIVLCVQLGNRIADYEWRMQKIETKMLEIEKSTQMMVTTLYGSAK